MKEHWSISKEKLVSLEEGNIRNGETSCGKPIVETTNGCKQLIQCVKFLLYLELLLFVGWTCYTIWQTYRVESMEVKITNSIRETESRNSLDQQLTSEKSTTTSDNLLAEMENLLEREKTLSQITVSNFKNRPDNDEINIVTKTTEGSNSEMKEAQESDIKESSPLLGTDVPKLIEVEVESVELEENSSDSLKSQENVLVWNFGLLPFPNIYNIKDRSQFVTSDNEQADKSENSETTEKLSKIDSNIEDIESEQITSDEAAGLTNGVLLSLLLQEAADSTQPLEEIPDQQSSAFNDHFIVMCADNKPADSTLESQIESESKEPKKDADIYDRSVFENSDESKERRASVGFDEQIQNPITKIESDFIEQYLRGDRDVKPIPENWFSSNIENDIKNLRDSLKYLDLSEHIKAELFATTILELLNRPGNSDVTPIDLGLVKMSIENTKSLEDQVKFEDPNRSEQQNTETTNDREHLRTL